MHFYIDPIPTRCVVVKYTAHNKICRLKTTVCNIFMLKQQKLQIMNGGLIKDKLLN